MEEALDLSTDRILNDDDDYETFAVLQVYAVRYLFRYSTSVTSSGVRQSKKNVLWVI